jgi:hypothetical protein
MNMNSTLETQVAKKRRYTLAIALVLVLYLLVGGITGYAMYRQKINDDNRRLSLQANQIKALTQSFYSRYISNFQVLSHLEAVRTKDSPALNRLFKKLNSQFKEFENVAIVDEEGFFFGSGQPFDINSPPNISGLPFFKALAKGDRQEVIMPPHKGPISGQPVTGVVIRLEDENGNYKGLLGTSIKFSKLRSAWDGFAKKNGVSYFFFGPDKKVTYSDDKLSLDLDVFPGSDPEQLTNDRTSFFLYADQFSPDAFGYGPAPGKQDLHGKGFYISPCEYQYFHSHLYGD